MTDAELFERYLRGEKSKFEEKKLEKIDKAPVSDNYDPFALIEKAVNTDFDSSVFEIIDDSDLPIAPNWLEFCISPKYLNLKPYPKQIKFGLEFFADYCPDCSDPTIMEELFDQPLQEILEKVQLLHHGKCPKCEKNRLEFYEEGKLGLYNELAGCAGQRGGKAIPLYSKIKIPNGWVKMEDIKIGDIVCTPDGKTAPVTHIFPQGVRPTYRIIFEDGRFADCDENHLWKVYIPCQKTVTCTKNDSHIYYSGSWRILTTKEIIEKRKKNQSVFIPLGLYCGVQTDLPMDPYILGCLLSNRGSICSSITITNIDSKILSAVKDQLIEKYYLNQVTKEGRSYRITQDYTENHLNYYKEILKNLKLYGKRAWEKFIPDIYKEASVEQRLELLRGLMDTGDEVNEEKLLISTLSYQLALDIQYLVRSLGGLCKISTKRSFYIYRGEKREGKTKYICCIRYQKPELLYKLDRKKERIKQNKEIIPGCKIKDIKYLGTQPTQCIMIDHPDHLYIIDDFIVTHNSVFVAMCANYQLHRFLKLSNPSHYFNLLPNQTLHMTFVAITYGQAADTLWQPFRDFYDNSPWFTTYNELLDHYQQKCGIELYQKKSTFLWYDHKRLTCYASGPDKRKLRGRTGFFSSIDELGWFHGTDKAIKLNPDQVCQALERSLRTIRSACRKKRTVLHHYNSPDALFVNISSPSAANDKIMRLVREKNIPTRYVFHLPTWEMNPTITRKDLEAEYRDDPIGAERDYGANPPLSDAPFISNVEIVESLIDKKYKNACKYTIRPVTDKAGHTTLRVKFFKFSLLGSDVNYIMGVDTGYSKNAFAVVVQHYELQTKCCITDFLIEIRPLEGVPIHFPSMYEDIIEPIIKTGKISIVVFDKWQSINFEQDLHAQGVESIRYSLKHDDFINIRGAMFSKKIVLPKPEIPFKQIINPSMDYHEFVEKGSVSHFLYQILTVRDLGRTVAKGLGVDDDIFRAWCLGVRFLLDSKYEKIFRKSIKKQKKVLGVVQNKSKVASLINSGVVAGKIGPLGALSLTSK